MASFVLEDRNDTQAHRSKLRDSLRRWRARLKPQDVGLVSAGKRRVPGLRREEVASLAEISVEWYTMLETARNIRVSPRVLDRLAGALQLSDKEKIELFSLAMDELPTVPDSVNDWDLDRATKKLWAACTVDETFTVASEQAAEYFPDAVLLCFVRRVAAGQWQQHTVIGRASNSQQVGYHAELASSRTPAESDELFFYPSLSGPGATATHRLNEFAFLHARVRSRGGIIGGIIVEHSNRRSYSAAEQAYMSGIASLTSLALA